VTGFATPPGRAGRLRLRHSLAAATRGAELLDQKLRVLRGEQRRLRAAAETADAAWRRRVREAERWLVRGLALSGESALAAAAGPHPADVTVGWTVTMGVRLPQAGPVRSPDPSPDTAGPANTALARAQDAYRAALRAAADHAAASAAARLSDAEVLRTRQRVRALRRHWIPRLEQELAALELALEEAEHEDAVRRRWVADDR
jgi:V/A-type H+-transporting ATPase subunit D